MGFFRIEWKPRPPLIESTLIAIFRSVDLVPQAMQELLNGELLNGVEEGSDKVV